MSASEKERENMSLYSVLLVDDEEEVFQVIMKKLDWEGMGFRIAGYARNGVEALEMAEELSVDVVMTDIKMPYMDGLTLCRKLKEQYQKIKVIIFSGFDEFEYAREAIKIEAEEYILKPINANELREVFERIKNNLDKELDEKRNIDKLREYYLESLPMLQENFLTSLIDGRIPEDSIEEYAKNCSLTLKGPYFVVTVLHISTTNPMEGALPIDPFLLAVSVKKLAEEQLAASEYDSKIVTYLGDGIVITQLPTEEAITRFTDCMDRSVRWQSVSARRRSRRESDMCAAVRKNCRCPISARRMPCPTVCSTAIPEPSILRRSTRRRMPICRGRSPLSRRS